MSDPIAWKALKASKELNSGLSVMQANQTHYDKSMSIEWDGDTTGHILAEQTASGAYPLILAKVSEETPTPEYLLSCNAIISTMRAGRKGDWDTYDPEEEAFTGSTSLGGDGWCCVASNTTVMIVAYAAGYECTPASNMGSYRMPAPGIYFGITTVRSANRSRIVSLVYRDLKVLDNKYIEPFVVHFSYSADDRVSGGRYAGSADKTFAEVFEAYAGPNLAFAKHGRDPLVLRHEMGSGQPMTFAEVQYPQNFSGSSTQAVTQEVSYTQRYYTIFPDDHVEVTEVFNDLERNTILNKGIVYHKLGCKPVEGGIRIDYKPITMPVENGVYTVLWNDVPYECTGVATTVLEKDCIVLGNTAQLGIEGGSDAEPFTLAFLVPTTSYYTGTLVFVHDETLYDVAATLKIYEKTSTSNKYLTTDEYGASMWADIPSSQPDWSQNDSTAADYVKNRTHYSETTISPIFTTSGTGRLQMGYWWDDIQPVGEFASFEVGVTYQVTRNGVSVTVEHAEYDDQNRIYGDCNEAGFNIVANADAGTYSVYTSNGRQDDVWELAIVNEAVTPLDEKYIPSTIARTEDIPSVEGFATKDYVASAIENAKASAEAVADAVGEAPTAEEFNALLASLRAAGLLKESTT